MAPQKGGVRPADSDEVDEVPGSIPRGQGGRPKIWKLLPDGTESRDQMITMTRASSLGDALENKFLIHRWDMRNLAFALSRRPDLVLQLAAIPDILEKPNKAEVHDIVKVALDFAGGNAAATKGSAIHRLSERLDAGEDLSYLPEQVLEALAVYQRLMSILRVVASETFVVCDELGSAGTYDRVVELLNDTEIRWTNDAGVEHVEILPAGTRLILDLKTNANAMYFGQVYACQEAVYGYGVPYTHEGGRGEWPDGLAPSREWGLLLHLPIESLEDAGFYWVDLRQGRDLAVQAAAHREAMKQKDLFWPTDLEPVKVAPSTDSFTIETADDVEDATAWLPTEAEVDQIPISPGMLLDWINDAPDEARLNELYDRWPGVWADKHTAAVKARLADLRAVQCPECALEDPAPWCDCQSDETCAGPCRRRAHKPGTCPPPVEKPAQVVALDLMAQLRQAPDGAALDALWEANQASWTASHTRMAKARARELSAQVPA